jgi:cytoskeletal protein RodZ
MTRDDEKPGNSIERARRFDANTPGSGSRQEPSFSNLEDLHEDGYEEPDRDTNFTSGYRADSVEEEEEFYDDAYPEEDEREAFADGEPDTLLDPEEAAEEEPDSWLEDEEPEERQGWPMGLVAVAILAVILLGAGGYGILQQRAAAEAEIRDLRAALAVGASPGTGGDSRSALDTLQQSYDKLSAQAEALTLENRRLADTVAGLEAQLGAQQSMPSKPAAAQSSPTTPTQVSDAPKIEKTAAPQVAESQVAESQTTAPQPATKQPAKPAPAAAPAAPKPVAEPSPAAERATSSPTGPWFVNFGTYATRNMADTWASRVRPSAGKVIVAPNEKDGRTLYRVRVIGLSDRESAQQVARKLESDLRVPALWVGRE